MVYEELAGNGLEIVAVALDSAGRPAVEPKLRPSDLDQRPEVLRRIRGWSEEQWKRKAPPRFPCLIDEAHHVATLYGMVNVPTAVWIDEQGLIVRPAEPAGATDHFRSMDPDTFAIPDEDAVTLARNRSRYLEALRDWVEKGPDSQFAFSAEEVRRRVRRPTENDVRAEVHVRIARHLYRRGAVSGARQHLSEALALCPERWNYRRQAEVLDPALVGAIDVSESYYGGLEALGDDNFYPAIDMPGIAAGRQRHPGG